MTIKLLKTSDLLAKVGKVAEMYNAFSQSFQSGGLIHETACECLLHAQKHGDTGPSQRLYEAIGGVSDPSKRAEAARKSMVKAESLLAWFLHMSSRQYTARKGTWGLVNKWKPDLFKLDEAEETPIQAFAQEEQKIRPFSAGKMVLNSLSNWEERVKELFKKNAPDKPYFIGDYNASMAFLKDVKDFATNRAKQEDARALGIGADGTNILEFPSKEELEGEKPLGEAPESKLIRNGEVVDEAGTDEEAPKAAAVA